MKVALSVPGKFHTFDLARELHARGALAKVFTGYPHFKLKREGLPKGMVHSWPWLQSSYMAFSKRHWLGERVVREWEWLIKTSLDAVVASRLPPCDVFVGLSGSALRSGRAAKAFGARYVCDRGSAHIRVQNELLLDEARRWGLPYQGIDPRVMAQEEAEYAEADAITVPSTFSVRSFVNAGVPAHKVHMLPYGVNLSTFHPTGRPRTDGFDVLFVGGMNLNKGIPYLLEAFKLLKHPRKTLTLAGAVSGPLIERMRAHGLWSDDIRVLGHVPQTQLKDLMSRSHVMVLPSVQEGFGMVLSQAMACGCVVIGSDHTGALDLIDDGRDGYIVPVRNSRTLSDRLQALADQPELQNQMSHRALQRVQSAGGWHDYGELAHGLFSQLLKGRA